MKLFLISIIFVSHQIHFIKSDEPNLTLHFTCTKTGEGLSKNFLKYLKKIFSPNIFIETGTCWGDSCKIAAQVFDEIHTIELDNNLYNNTKNLFQDQSHVHVYHGDSKIVLNEILPKISGKILFFLDAHWSSGITAKGDENSPIIYELKLIKKYNHKDALIIIDDARFFQAPHIIEKELEINPLDRAFSGYPSLDELKKIILDINPKYQIIIYGDMIIVFPKESYISISPIIQAMTISRFHDINDERDLELAKAEEIISKAVGIEKSAIQELIYRKKLKNLTMHSMHYKLWYALTLLPTRKEEALKEINHLCEIGFDQTKLKILQ